MKWISYMYTYIPSHLDLPPTSLPPLEGHHRARSWAPCAIQQLPASYPFYTRHCEYINPHSPVHLSPLLHVHLSILHVCISIPALQTLTLQMKESICHKKRYHINRKSPPTTLHCLELNLGAGTHWSPMGGLHQPPTWRLHFLCCCAEAGNTAGSPRW